jgi:hypothetical protein
LLALDTKTLEQRKHDYEKARKRIFEGEDTDGLPGS